MEGISKIYLGPPRDSLLKTLPKCAQITQSQEEHHPQDKSQDNIYIYGDYFVDLKSLHNEWKESLYEKDPKEFYDEQMLFELYPIS